MFTHKMSSSMEYDGTSADLCCCFCFQPVQSEFRMCIEYESATIKHVAFIHSSDTYPLNCMDRKETEMTNAVTSRLHVPYRYNDDRKAGETTLDFIERRNESLKTFAYEYTVQSIKDIRFSYAGFNSYTFSFPRETDVPVLPQMLSNRSQFGLLFNKVAVFKLDFKSKNDTLEVTPLQAAMTKSLSQTKTNMTRSDYRVWAYMDQYINELHVVFTLVMNLSLPEVEWSALYLMSQASSAATTASPFLWSAFLRPYETDHSENWTAAFNRCQSVLRDDATSIMHTLTRMNGLANGIELKIDLISDQNVSGMDIEWNKGKERLQFRMNAQCANSESAGAAVEAKRSSIDSFHLVSSKGNGLLKYKGTGSIDNPVPILYQSSTEQEERQILQDMNNISTIQQVKPTLLKLIHMQDHSSPPPKAKAN